MACVAAGRTDSGVHAAPGGSFRRQRPDPRPALGLRHFNGRCRPRFGSAAAPRCPPVGMLVTRPPTGATATPSITAATPNLFLAPLQLAPRPLPPSTSGRSPKRWRVLAGPPRLLHVFAKAGSRRLHSRTTGSRRWPLGSGAVILIVANSRPAGFPLRHVRLLMGQLVPGSARRMSLAQFERRWRQQARRGGQGRRPPPQGLFA